MTLQVDAGNVVRTTITFVPATGTVALADVTCRVLKYDGSVESLTPVSGGTNIFYADVAVPDTVPNSRWRFRWESRTPSPVITLDDLTTRFDVLQSDFPNP